MSTWIMILNPKKMSTTKKRTKNKWNEHGECVCVWKPYIWMSVSIYFDFCHWQNKFHVNMVTMHFELHFNNTQITCTLSGLKLLLAIRTCVSLLCHLIFSINGKRFIQRLGICWLFELKSTWMTWPCNESHFTERRWCQLWIDERWPFSSTKCMLF